MVVDTDAVVDPGTVMIKSLDALIASVTMARTWSPYYQAIWAQLDGIHELHKFQEINLFWLSDESRISKLRNKPKDDGYKS